MEIGRVVEYIDREKIVCAVVLEAKNLRLRLLTESNREVKLSVNRLSHKGGKHLDMSMGRDRLVEALKAVADKRRALISGVDLQELWDVLNDEQEWIDLDIMTAFCFPDNPGADHESAVMRAFFKDRLYFKFNPDRFFPHSQQQVEQIAAQLKETERRNRLIARGGNWLKQIRTTPESPAKTATEFSSAEQQEIIAILKSVYLEEKESAHFSMGKALLAKAGINSIDAIFGILVKLGVWPETENIDLHRFNTPVEFPAPVLAQADRMAQAKEPFSPPENLVGVQTETDKSKRLDLTSLRLMTIDGQSTLDYDDALSIEKTPDGLRLGVHIADVAHFIKPGDEIDREALSRGSAIYMPDQKISMIPPGLAENLCSLKASELRPAISVLIKLSSNLDLVDYDIAASLIRVKNQYTYFDVNNIAETDPEIITLLEIGRRFRGMRLDQGAVQITLPEVNIWLDPEGQPTVSRINRESPGRLLVAELMIMANWLMANYLARHRTPAIFRSQMDPKDRLYKGNNGTMFQNWMQRKLLARFMLNTRAEPHSGLGLKAYVTATSPIRKYFDLLTQRQIRSILGLEKPYTQEEIEHHVQLLAQPMTHVGRLQFRRNRFWLMKYLESVVGQKEEALVLGERRNHYLILLTQYMVECQMTKATGFSLKAEDLVQVTIQHVNARKDVLTVFLS